MRSNITRFDAAIIEEFARRLLSQARTAIVVYTIIGLLMGGAAGYYFGAERIEAAGSGVVGLACALIGAGIGYAIGMEKAFRYRLEAHTALCQVSIERNTRETVTLLSRWEDQARRAAA